MRLIKNFIKEKEMLSKVTSHKKAIEGALEQAKRLGQGSSRAVFDFIDPEYGETVIKVAKNKKGLAQNEFELGIFRDRLHPDILPELYDYDKDSEMLKKNNNMPLWIQVEKVSKLTEKKFEKLLGVPTNYLADYLYSILGPHYHFEKSIPSEVKEKFSEDEFVQELLSLAGNYDLDINDITFYRNLGEKNNKLILIDAGLNEEIYKTYYRKDK